MNDELKKSIISSFKTLPIKDLLDIDKVIYQKMFDEIRKNYNKSYGSNEEIDFSINYKKYLELIGYKALSCEKDNTPFIGYDYLVQTNKGVLKISIKKDDGFDWFNPGDEIFKNETIRMEAKRLSGIKNFSDSEEKETREILVKQIVSDCNGKTIDNLISDKYLSFITTNRPDYIFVYKDKEIKIIKHDEKETSKDDFKVIENKRGKYNIKIIDNEGKHCFSLQIKRSNGRTSGYRHNFWCCATFKKKYFKSIAIIRR